MLPFLFNKETYSMGILYIWKCKIKVGKTCYITSTWKNFVSYAISEVWCSVKRQFFQRKTINGQNWSGFTAATGCIHVYCLKITWGFTVTSTLVRSNWLFFFLLYIFWWGLSSKYIQLTIANWNCNKAVQCWNLKKMFSDMSAL